MILFDCRGEFQAGYVSHLSLILYFLMKYGVLNYCSNTLSSCSKYGCCLVLSPFFSMILWDGLQKNTIQMTSNLLLQSKPAQKLVLHNQALFGMKHRVITMMLHLGFTMMGILVRILFELIRKVHIEEHP